MYSGRHNEQVLLCLWSFAYFFLCLVKFFGIHELYPHTIITPRDKVTSKKKCDRFGRIGVSMSVLPHIAFWILYATNHINKICYVVHFFRNVFFCWRSGLFVHFSCWFKPKLYLLIFCVLKFLLKCCIQTNLLAIFQHNRKTILANQ